MKTQSERYRIIKESIDKAIWHCDRAKEFLNKIKITTLLALVLFASCSIRPVCRLDNATVKVTKYIKLSQVYWCESLNGSCYGSFRTDDKVNIGDTVKVRYIYGSIAGNQVPYVEIIK